MTQAKRKNSAYAGYHKFLDHEGFEYGSFEVFWLDPADAFIGEALEDPGAPGWYWCACFPGCIPDGDPTGPFTSSSLAYRDAREA